MEEEHPTEIRQKPTASFLNGVVLGILVGAGAFFLLGTKEGKESRKKLLQKSKKFLDQIEKIIDELEDKSGKLVKKGAKVGQEMGEKAVLIKKELKKQEKKLKKTVSQIKKIERGASKTISQAKKRFFRKKGKSLGK